MKKNKEIALENGEEIIEQKIGDFWSGDFGTEENLKDGIESFDVISSYTVRRKLLKDYSQIQGKFIFTNKRIHFQATLSKEYKFDIYYNEIKKLETFKVMYWNTGIFIICENKVYPISILRRKKYIDIIKQYM